MKKIQSQSTSNACSIAQAAAQAALEGSQDCVTEMVKAFKQRHDYLVAALNELPGVSCLASDGTFYAFPDMHDAMSAKGYDDDIAFAEALLNEAGVALVPGSAFGAPGHLRLSFATSLEVLQSAMARIGDWLKAK